MLAMPEASGILERLDRIARELAAIRTELAGQPAAAGNGLDTGDDFADEHLLDSAAAASRVGYPPDTIRKWCRTALDDLRPAGRGEWGAALADKHEGRLGFAFQDPQPPQFIAALWRAGAGSGPGHRPISW